MSNPGTTPAPLLPGRKVPTASVKPGATILFMSGPATVVWVGRLIHTYRVVRLSATDKWGTQEFEIEVPETHGLDLL
jgi:hypothetical protein